MKLFLIIGESYFYHPKFVDEFLNKTKDDVVGAALVTKAPQKADLEKYLLEHFYYLTPLELLRLGVATVAAIVKGSSVRAIFEKHNISYFQVKDDINKAHNLEKIRETKPDVIVSSNPYIFKDELLKIPKVCCLNRHSSLLPSYGGLWPVFHALRAGEKFTGVTVHTMVKKIDGGTILAQKKVRITKSKTVSELYKETFGLSTSALLRALDKVRTHDFSSVVAGTRPSYFSFPTSENWREFRARGGRFI